MNHPHLTFLTTYRGKSFYCLKNDYISHCIKEYGMFSPTEIFFLEKFIGETDNVIEIGANNGCHAVYLSERNKKGKYFCFEPQMEIFKLLSTNCMINDCQNVLVYPYGISDKANIVYYNSRVYQDNNTGAFAIPESKSGVDFLKCQTMNYFKEIQDLQSIKLIKIDVEGMEVIVVNSMFPMIKKFKPILFIEYTKDTFAPLCMTLMSLQYRVFHFNTNSNQYHNCQYGLQNRLADTNVVAFHKDFPNIPKYLTEVKEQDMTPKYDITVHSNTVLNN